jgi:hypothetical protein
MAVGGAEHIRDVVAKHAQRLEAAADAMTSDGIGQHLTSGHAVVLRRMASSMRAEAAAGALPSRWNDSIYGSADTQSDRILRVESSDGSPPIQGGGLPSVIAHMLTSRQVSMPATGSVRLAELDGVLASAGMPPDQKIAVKRSLQLAGRLVA